MYPMPVCSVAGGDIYDCIQRGDTQRCVVLIQNDRSVLKQKGWGGFTPLHYAALHGNRPLVDALLSQGADPNLTSDAGQTAFHFACRQGNIYIMHHMMQRGADLRLLDLQGKTALHHAVLGGSIVAIHYLWETGLFRYSDTDSHRVSSLHLAASTSNTEVLRYLLRHQRCAVDAVDHQGATALHVAAERGGVEVCWTLLQRTGYGMLHQKNHHGLTPLDLSSLGKTYRHQQLTKLLSRYINEPVHHMPKESRVLYYWSLLFPALSGAGILLIAAAVGGYGGALCGLMFPWLARSIFTAFHRMTTYQRLPNPIYLGTLFAGLFHTLLCFYGKLMLNGALVQVSMVHFTLVLGLLCKVLTQDPGVLGQAHADPRFSCVADLVEKNEKPQRFCPYCELFQPDRAKHCRLCDVCVADYDHHCLFLNRCVGRGNHRLFLLFLLAMVIAHLLFLATATSYLCGRRAAGRHTATAAGWSSWLPLLETEFWVAALMAMNALTLLWEAWLLSEQFGALAAGTTTYFMQLEAPAGRSFRQRWAAILSFLLEGRRPAGRRQANVDKTAIDI